jgi:uncharacterized membrane protein
LLHLAVGDDSPHDLETGPLKAPQSFVAIRKMSRGHTFEEASPRLGGRVLKKSRVEEQEEKMARAISRIKCIVCQWR